MTRRNRQRKRQQRTDKSDARSKTLFKSLVENRFVQFCGALTAVVVVVQWALAQFYGPSVELGLEAVQEPFSAPFKISNQSKLFALHNVQMHCGINRVRYAGGQEAFRGFTLAYGKPFDILAGQQVEHSCYLANLRASDISTASEDIWLSYDMLWMGNRKTEPLAISWFAKGNPPRWIVGDDPMLNQ